MIKYFRFEGILLIALLLVTACSEPVINNFVKVEDSQFKIAGETYEFVGTNFWYGAYLGRPGEEGNRERLNRELDLLKENGITNLRVLGASEESSFENSLEPTFLNADGSFNETLLIGLDYLLAEMGKRDMKAVIFLNNYWEWSGGMSTYNGWFGDGPVIDPADGDWEAFMKYSARFYQNEQAQEHFKEYIKTVVSRTNTVTGKPYTNDSAIMSWQLANEPRPGRGESSIKDIPAYIEWIDETAGFIKNLSPNHLVSTGSEGKTGSLDSMNVFVEAHSSEHVDYLTFHMWAKNWGWVDTGNMAETVDEAVVKARDYITEHLAVAEKMKKPIVMEEFGFPRNDEQYDPDAPTTYRDQYYKMVFSEVEEHDIFAGSNFWSWGGYGEAQNSESYWWSPGDPFTGDPPQEPQGLNSIFASDTSTLIIIRNHAEQLKTKRLACK
jgi:mannan endo-1,4-beta-mannosidase